MKNGDYILIDGKWEKIGEEVSVGLFQRPKKKLPEWLQEMLTEKWEEALSPNNN